MRAHVEKVDNFGWNTSDTCSLTIDMHHQKLLAIITYDWNRDVAYTGQI